MRPIYLPATLLLAVVLIIGCKKGEISQVAEVVPPQTKKDTATGGNSPGDASRSYINFRNLTELPDDTWTDGYMIFQSIVASTGSFMDGEPVESISFSLNPNTVQNVIESSSTGPFFYYVTGVPIGVYNPVAMHDAWDEYQADWAGWIAGDSTGPLPYLEDYLKPNLAHPGTLITSGVVIRKNNSPSTFATAPATFIPVIPHLIPLLIGFLYQGSYIIDLEGNPGNGAVTMVRLYNTSWQPIPIEGFVGTFTPRVSPMGSYDVVGEIILTDHTIVPFSGIAQ